MALYLSRHFLCQSIRSQVSVSLKSCQNVSQEINQFTLTRENMILPASFHFSLEKANWLIFLKEKYAMILVVAQTKNLDSDCLAQKNFYQNKMPTKTQIPGLQIQRLIISLLFCCTKPLEYLGVLATNSSH